MALTFILFQKSVSNRKTKTTESCQEDKLPRDAELPGNRISFGKHLPPTFPKDKQPHRALNSIEFMKPIALVFGSHAKYWGHKIVLRECHANFR
jgi:hypothetical protein